MRTMIRVDKMSREVQEGGRKGDKIIVTFDVITSTKGQLSFDVKVNDQESLAELEKTALLDLQTLLQEALDAVRHRLAPRPTQFDLAQG